VQEPQIIEQKSGQQLPKKNLLLQKIRSKSNLQQKVKILQPGKKIQLKGDQSISSLKNLIQKQMSGQSHELANQNLVASRGSLISQLSSNSRVSSNKSTHKLRLDQNKIQIIKKISQIQKSPATV
jgi:hypothetical protein